MIQNFEPTTIRHFTYPGPSTLKNFCVSMRFILRKLWSIVDTSLNKTFILTCWRRNYFFLTLAHSVYKMWIIEEPNKLELWNKLHFEGKKTKSIYHVLLRKIFGPTQKASREWRLKRNEELEKQLIMKI